MGIEEVIIAPRSPWQTPCIERLIGSIRRECLANVGGTESGGGGPRHRLPVQLRDGPGRFYPGPAPLSRSLARRRCCGNFPACGS